MINKLALAMIVATMTALPVSFAHAQDSKPVGANGMPTNCAAGDTACTKKGSDATNGTMSKGDSATMSAPGTTANTGTSAADPAGNGTSPKCSAGDNACDPNAMKGAAGTMSAPGTTANTGTSAADPAANGASPKCNAGDTACDPNAKTK